MFTDVFLFCFVLFKCFKLGTWVCVWVWKVNIYSHAGMCKSACMWMLWGKVKYFLWSCFILLLEVECAIEPSSHKFGYTGWLRHSPSRLGTKTCNIPGGFLWVLGLCTQMGLLSDMHAMYPLCCLPSLQKTSWYLNTICVSSVFTLLIQ